MTSEVTLMRSAVWVFAIVTSGLACGPDDMVSTQSSATGNAGQTAGAAAAPTTAPAAGTKANAPPKSPGGATTAGRVSSASAGTSAAPITASPAVGGAGASSVAPAAGGGGTVSTASQAAGASGGGAGSAAGADAAPMTATTAPGEPKIPPIMGDCPMFASGTATIGGLRGITVQVGEMKAEKGPLLFYWHGTGQTASMVNQSVPNDVRDEILKAGGIIISPSGSLGTGGDCSGTGTFYKDDFNVADLIVACGVKNHNIDPRRIYTTGCSAGGLHAGCMANMRASYLAAAAPNSGGIIGMQPKDDPHVPALITMHGGPGDVVIVTFSETSKTLYTAFAAMGGTVVNCNHGGGHCGAPAALERAAWQFMKDNPFGAPNPYTGGLPSTFPQYCEIIKQ
jgi:hypothetical protein